MKPSIQIRIITGLLLFSYGTAMWMADRKQNALHEKHLMADADVIAPALWNFDSRGPRPYLRIAARLHDYEHVTIYSNDDSTPFIDLSFPDKSPLDAALTRAGLIPSKKRQVAIRYRGRVIGRLEVTLLHKTIYPALYWFLVTGLACFGSRYFIQMLHTKELLEIRVRERTHELQESKENLRVTLQSICDAVIATDTDGLITGINPVAAALTGWAESEAIGQPLDTVFNLEQPDRPQNATVLMQRILAESTGPERLHPDRLISRDGTEFVIADAAAPIRNTAGTMIGVVMVFRDITEELALQENLKQADQMRVMGQLAGGIAHDFNNMLGGIIGASELLQDHIPSDSEPGNYLNMIHSAADKAAALTKQLLLLARKQNPEWLHLEVHCLIQDTVALLSTTLKQGIQLITDLSAEEDLILGDSAMLQSVFMNLGINASHAIADTGTITFHTRTMELGPGNTLQLKPGRYIEVTVSDTGCGIEREHLSRIFEPFFTTKSKGHGTGLGLSTAFATIQQHRGGIRVASTPGTGTRFTIDLPLTDRPHDQQPGPAASA